MKIESDRTESAKIRSCSLLLRRAGGSGVAARSVVEDTTSVRPGVARERGWLTAGGEPPAFSEARSQLVQWDISIRASGVNPGGARRGGREEEGSTNPTIQTTQPANHPEQACVVSPSPLVPPPAVSLPPTCRATPRRGREKEKGREGGEGRKLVGPPLCTSGYILDKELSRSSARGRRRISSTNKGTTLFCPFQLNPHRYTLGGGSVSSIRSRVREALTLPLSGKDNRISASSPNSIRNSHLASTRPAY